MKKISELKPSFFWCAFDLICKLPAGGTEKRRRFDPELAASRLIAGIICTQFVNWCVSSLDFSTAKL